MRGQTDGSNQGKKGALGFTKLEKLLFLDTYRTGTFLKAAHVLWIHYSHFH